MKIVFCFLFLFSGSYAFGENDPVFWSIGYSEPGNNEFCENEIIKLPDENAVAEKQKTVNGCLSISYAEWKDFEDPISVVTVPEGDVWEYSIKVRIEAQKYLNGELTICWHRFTTPYDCRHYNCCGESGTGLEIVD